MRYLSIFLIGCIVFFACRDSKKIPTRADIIGRWTSEEKAELVLENDSTVKGKFLPAELIFFPPDSFINVRFSGSGHWRLRKGRNQWEIYIDFDSVSGVNKLRCAFPLFIEGNSKDFEETKGRLYIWKDEGDNRYRFFRPNR